jgi:hypothetical protein
VVADERWEDDCFKHGRYWYTWHEGWWYRAKKWNGPYRVIEARHVPTAIHRVPVRHWKRHPDHHKHSHRAKHHRRHDRRHDHDRDRHADVVVRDRDH